MTDITDKGNCEKTGKILQKYASFHLDFYAARSLSSVLEGENEDGGLSGCRAEKFGYSEYTATVVPV